MPKKIIDLDALSEFKQKCDLAYSGGAFDYDIVADAFDTSGSITPNTYSSGWIVFRSWNDEPTTPGGQGTYHEEYFQNTSDASVTSDVPPEEDSAHWTIFTNYIAYTGSGTTVDAYGYVQNSDGTIWQNNQSWSSWFQPFDPSGTPPSGFTAAGGESWVAGTASYHQYAIGDYCIYDDKLYVCVSPTTGEAWVPSKWSETQVMDEITSDYNTLLTKLNAIPNKNIWYGYCSTAAATQTKVVSLTNGTTFNQSTGDIIVVRFSNGNTYNGTCKLQVGSKSASNVYSTYNSTTSQYYWQAGEVVVFVYAGRWVMVEKAPATTSYYGPTKLSSATDSSSETEAATPKAVKAAYDMAAAGGYTVTFTTTGNLVQNAVFTSSDGELSTCPASITLVTTDTDSTYRLYPLFFTDAIIPTIMGIVSDGTNFYKATFVWSSGKYSLVSLTQF